MANNTQYTLTVTEEEHLALDYITSSIQNHFTNALQSRAKLASHEIRNILYHYCNENEIAIATGEINQLKQAYELKLIERANSAGGSPVPNNN